MTTRRQMTAPTFDPMGSHTSNASISSATTLTPPTGASLLMIQATGQNVLITLDGTTPTTTAGFTLYAGDPPSLVPVAPDAVIKVIQSTATARINYQFGTA